MARVSVMVLDSFTLLAFFRQEAGAGRVVDLLRQGYEGATRLTMTVANLGEVVYRTIREHGAERADEVLARIREYPIELIDVDLGLALAAAHLKGRHRIAYADCLAAALAQRLGATIVTGDPDFRQLEGTIAVEWLVEGEVT
jgi:ribonuclease VapC